MNAEYLPAFVKDLKALRGTAAYAKVHKLAFEQVADWNSVEELGGAKKLQGYRNAWRLRVGDYRVGFLFDGRKIIFARVLHRKEIYRYFP